MTDYDIRKAFAAIEEELIASMMRNLTNHRAQETAEGIQWSQWQVEQLSALEQYKRRNKEKFGGAFAEMNRKIGRIIAVQRAAGQADQEVGILDALKAGVKLNQAVGQAGMSGEFFKTNDRKLESLIKATANDMRQAETAVLRRANDAYRKVIFNAQVYANTGAGTYEKAVDMATKDFLASGIQCVVYKNGSRHTISDYADMALKTASKRAYLQGEGERRKEWGISTVIINKRGGACPKCAKFCGKVFIDDVWSGGQASDGPYPLLSSAIQQGLYHPRCKDSHSTYFPELYEDDDPGAQPYTQQEINGLERQEATENRQQYAQRQAEKFFRLAKWSLDSDNQWKYEARAQEWQTVVENSGNSAIIKAENTEGTIQVHSIGTIDRTIYQCVSDDIDTDEVIITDERIEHIKERHPNDYERYKSYIKETVNNPDFILEANRPNTAFVLKQIKSEGKHFELILRLKVSKDPGNYKNSIITFLKVSEKKWNKYLRNKKVLYRRE